MAKPKIDSTKLEQLRDYFLNKGSTAQEDVAEQLDTDERDVIDAYIAALRKKYPKDFPTPEDESTDEQEEDTPSFFLLGEGNLMTELVLHTRKDDKIVFKVKEPEDKVQVLVKGTIREIDLYQLRKNPEGETFGTLNSTLIALGEIAKG